MFIYIESPEFQAYDNVESSVRKASVFCMVAMHQVAGELLQPHLATLNGSKLKLLNLVRTKLGRLPKLSKIGCIRKTVRLRQRTPFLSAKRRIGIVGSESASRSQSYDF
jgi:hypothetical protein